jgi:hypothetical protein
MMTNKVYVQIYKTREVRLGIQRPDLLRRLETSHNGTIRTNSKESEDEKRKKRRPQCQLKSLRAQREASVSV